MSKQRIQKVPLIDYVDGVARELGSLLPEVLHGQVDAVHDARVAIGRLKAASDLLGPILPAKPVKSLRKTLRNLRRRLGPLRDADVMLARLEKLAGEPRWRAASLWLRERLRAQRDRALRKVVTRVDRGRVLAKMGACWVLHQDVVGAADQVEAMLLQSVKRQLDAFEQRLGKLDRPMDAQQRAAAGAPGQPKPQALRCAARNLRFTLEMGAAQGHCLPVNTLRIIKGVQEALGLWHDHLVLAECAMACSAQQELAHHDAELQAEVVRLVAFLLRRAESQLRRVSRMWKERGQGLLGSIYQGFDLPTIKMAQPPALIAPPTIAEVTAAPSLDPVAAQSSNN